MADCIERVEAPNLTCWACGNAKGMRLEYFEVKFLDAQPTVPVTPDPITGLKIMCLCCGAENGRRRTAKRTPQPEPETPPARVKAEAEPRQAYRMEQQFHDFLKDLRSEKPFGVVPVPGWINWPEFINEWNRG